MKKRFIAILMAVVTAMALMLSGCGETKNDTPQSAATPTEKVTPTFMYFVSNSDENFESTQSMIDEIEKNYNDKVNFSVINIDENTEAAANFPVQGNTPMLIMLNTSNDISAFAPKCADKAELEKYIEDALK